MKVTDKSYQEHHVFTDLQKLMEFYDQLSISIFSFPSMGTNAICSIDTYVYSSMQGTLESISLTLKAGRINDAYALLRKYHDSAIINIYTNLYLRKNCSPEKLIIEKINNWLRGKETLPEYRVLSKYIRETEDVQPISNAFYSDDRYKELRNRCNDHTHYNFYKHVMLNDNQIHLDSREKWITRLSNDTRDLVILHISYVFFINNHYMMSGDYIDALECGMQPEEGSQYWVAPFVQKFFDETVTTYRPDITAVIKSHSAMQLK